MTASEAKNAADMYINIGVRSSIIMGGIVFGLFSFWYYTSLKHIAKTQRELEEVYMGPEITGPRVAGSAI